MKNRILTFIIGMLVGAIIATAGFFIYQKVNKNNFDPKGNMEQMRERGNGEIPPEMPNGQQGNGLQRPGRMPENANQISGNTSNT